MLRNKIKEKMNGLFYSRKEFPIIDIETYEECAQIKKRSMSDAGLNHQGMFESTKTQDENIKTNSSNIKNGL